MIEFLTSLLLLAAATLRLAAPLLFAALAGLYAERAGVIDLSLEGKLLAGAFAAASVASLTGSPALAVAAAMAIALLLALLHGFATITHRGNQVVSSMAINIIAAGLIPTIALAMFRQAGETPSLPPSARFLPIELPFADAARAGGLAGRFYAELLGHQTLLTYLAFLAVPITAWLLGRTGWGLRLRAVGENPYAVDVAGWSVQRIRYQALVANGLLAGMGGAYLSLAANAGFVRDMSAGKGYLAIAALIFGRWRPVPTLCACLLFAFTDIVQAQLQGRALPLVGTIPSSLVSALPYLVTVLVLAFVGGSRGMPRALGLAYAKERG